MLQNNSGDGEFLSCSFGGSWYVTSLESNAETNHILSVVRSD